MAQILLKHTREVRPFDSLKSMRQFVQSVALLKPIPNLPCFPSLGKGVSLVRLDLQQVGQHPPAIPQPLVEGGLCGSWVLHRGVVVLHLVIHTNVKQSDKMSVGEAAQLTGLLLLTTATSSPFGSIVTK